jgi:hypothetical protein
MINPGDIATAMQDAITISPKPGDLVVIGMLGADTDSIKWMSETLTEKFGTDVTFVITNHKVSMAYVKAIIDKKIDG